MAGLFARGLLVPGGAGVSLLDEWLCSLSEVSQPEADQGGKR